MKWTSLPMVITVLLAPAVATRGNHDRHI